MCWFIYQLTVAGCCCDVINIKIINLKTCYIIFVTATPFLTLCIKILYENLTGWLIIVYIGKQKI